MKFKFHQPLAIIFVSILSVFIIARIVSYLVIVANILPDSFFITVDGYRMHHFVYGNILILITSFIAIGLRSKVNENWLALFYGIGLGLVLDEFPLWMGDINQLQSKVVFIPYAPTVVLISLIILAVLILIKDRRDKV